MSIRIKGNHCQGCPCGNCKIYVKTRCNFSELCLKGIPFDWETPMCSGDSIVMIKYKEFCQISPLPEGDSFCVLYCNLCKINVCCFIPTIDKQETFVVINPLLRLSEEIRSRMIYSETYELWIKDDEKINDTTNNWSSNDITDKMLFQKKQEVIDALFEEKERKVREYVIQQEDLFEAKREEVKKHYSLLKQQCKKHNIITMTESEKKEMNCDEDDQEMEVQRRDSFDQADLFAAPKVNGQLEFDEPEEEEEDDEDVPPLTQPIQTLQPVPILQNQQSPSFPATFKELALSKTNNSFGDFDSDSEN